MPSKQNPIKGWNEQIYQPEGKIYVFHIFIRIYKYTYFETPKSSILKQLEIKIVSDHSRFQKLQIGKRKRHMYLKLCNYQDCWIS